MDFATPDAVRDLLDDLDEFIEAEIEPLEREHPEFFDERREHARTDWEAGGVPAAEWEALLDEMRERADDAGFYRYALPEELGGQDGSNLAMAMVREHLAERGPGLHNVLQQEASVVGNFPIAKMLHRFGDEAQRDLLEAVITRETPVAFGLTEPEHGSDATWMETTARKEGDEWIIDGAKRWNSGMHRADYDLVFARTDGEDGDAAGITAFLVPTDADGLEIDFFWWTFNMPTDHAEVTLDGVRVPDSAVVGERGRGLALAQSFLHENRIRQAAASLGAAQFCIDAAVDYARERETWGEPLSSRQAVQFPLAELHTEADMLRSHVHRTAWLLDREGEMVTESRSSISEKVAMANWTANDLVCRAADRAMQVHGGLGYSRHQPFEHVYRHHRRYRITEGTEEIQKRRVAGHLFGFIGGD
ncbi:acyl-CoA dehydrogenase family protein [Haloglomus litoreum]|uniref:acyl-CoA dehydrogenase family protein n=1 Tax=Haloglomus litoreum TaxID=3034026 RepID=UPI0023E80A29|nr:acyl-CoA dehydrogenase family protein [Haloglomus sp. DT116]